MQSDINKPLLVYDNECNFCKYWIEQWKHITGERVEYLPYQEIAEQFPNIPLSDFQKSVHFITQNDKVYTGAEAVFKALNLRFVLWCYYKLPIFSTLTETLYKFIAQNRQLFSTITRWLWGTHNVRTTHHFSRWLFLRGLGIVYLIAFVSLWVQIHGLIGSNGILPVENYLTAVHQQIGVKGYYLVPTLCWLNSSDTFLHLICATGVIFSLVLIAGFLPTICLIGLWTFYLTLVTVGQTFLNFQWDVLLLEIGLLAVFFAPLKLRDSFKNTTQISKAFLWLLRWLLFRLMFASGYVKLASDEVWRNLTALNYHYETQPLPTWLGWYIHHLPDWVHKISTVGMFAIELGVPFLIFAPRRGRSVGCVGLISLQILIILTGNYCFFNLLTIVLCLLLIDDITWKSILPKRFGPNNFNFKSNRNKLSKVCIITLATIFFVISCNQFGGQIFRGTKFPELTWIQPFRSINTYGLFADMTESRPEIVVEGSNDGVKWETYEFKWKPGNLNRAPQWVAPHQPRLDWQMWFAALRGNYQNTSWFLNFMGTLLYGKPEVLRLLSKNPFPNKPPRYVRAILYEYEFTDLSTKRKDGTWWQRKRLGIYCPTISLR